MQRGLRSGPSREVPLATAWAVVFVLLLALRVVFLMAEGRPPDSRTWLQLGSLVLLLLLVGAAVLGGRQPRIGSVVLRIEQAAVFVAITRLLGLGTQPDPGRAEQVLIALLGVHAVGAIAVSDELSTGTLPWRMGLWILALSFGALTISVLAR